MSAAPRVIELEGVTTFYGSIQALKGISLHVDPGEIVTLIGANGAGKSTALRTISGLIKPRDGKITFEGQDVTGLSAHEIVGLGIAQSPEGPTPLPAHVRDREPRDGRVPAA